MSALLTPFEPGASLARVVVTASGYAIDCRSPRAAHRCVCRTAGEAAETARLYRDCGGWPLRFGDGTDEVRALVAELDGMKAGGGA